MKRFAVISVSCLALLSLSACQTSGTSSEATQSTLTNAAMLSEGADCNQLASGIQQMDQIIVANSSNTSSTYNSSGDTFSGTKQTINQHLFKSDIFRNNSGIASDVMRAVTGGNNQSSSSQLEAQQTRNAQTEKSRLIKLFQQKKCVHAN